MRHMRILNSARGTHMWISFMGRSFDICVSPMRRYDSEGEGSGGCDAPVPRPVDVSAGGRALRYAFPYVGVCISECAVLADYLNGRSVVAGPSSGVGAPAAGPGSGACVRVRACVCACVRAYACVC